jgi:hypothetical protein
MEDEYIIVNKKNLYIEMPTLINVEYEVEKVKEVEVEKVKEVEVEKVKVEVEEVKVEVKDTLGTGMNMIIESNLSEDQKKYAAFVYDSTKLLIQEFILTDMNDILKITFMISKIVKQIENVKIYKKYPTGMDKKAITIELGRIFIKDMIPDSKSIMMVYDVIAEPTLETMIDVSNNVNVSVATCCPTILKLFKLVS